MNIRYYLGAIMAIPLLPFLYLQGKRVKARMPKLPPASGAEGLTSERGGVGFRLLAIGESTMAGIGVATHQEGFTGTLAQELSNALGTNVYWQVGAKSGYTAKKVRKQILPVIKTDKADLIVVGLGANDAFELNSPRRWKRDVNQLILDLRERFPAVTIAFTNMPPIKEFPSFTPLMKSILGNLVEMLGEALEEVVASHKNVFYYDRKLSLADWINQLNEDASPASLFSDGVHPSKLTYQLWAKDFAGFLVDQQALGLSEQYPE